MVWRLEQAPLAVGFPRAIMPTMSKGQCPNTHRRNDPSVISVLRAKAQTCARRATALASLLQLKAPLQRAKPMMWIHIHKAAGTTMCWLAKQNGEKVVQPNENCNWVDQLRSTSDDVSEFMEVPKVTCEDRAAYFFDNGFTWGQLERELYPGSFCPDAFDYGIMLREPEELITSFFDFQLPHYHDFLRCLGANNCDPISPGNVDHWMGRNAWIFMDNFVVRVLLGQEGMKVPIGGITLDHWQAAVDRLSKFRIVAFVEDLSKYATADMFKNKLSWHAGVLTTHANPTRDRANLTDDEIALIRNRTAYDKKLYDHFRREAHEKSRR